MSSLDTWLEGRGPVRLGCAASLGLGLFFIFAWAPHPWGWHGIDQYHTLALQLARGERFQTTDVPWGYAYFLAAFYRLFGERLWIPLVAQAILNATAPLIAYHLVASLLDRKTAAVTALLVGALSFNTIYASTQSSDSVCTVLFLLGTLAAVRSLQDASWRMAALAGLAFGLASQLRPNLIAFPLVWALMYLWRPLVTQADGRRPGDFSRRWSTPAIIVLLALAVDVPWIVRNYRLTREFIPTSTHGSVQLWYGTLQVGPYLNSRAHNPASLFEAPAFDYVSLDRVPI